MNSAFPARCIAPLLDRWVLAAKGIFHRCHEAAFVLHRADHIIRRVHIIGDVIKLCGRDHVKEIVERVAAIIAHHYTAIVSIDEVVGIGWIDPQCVVITMVALAAAVWSHHIEGLATIGALRDGHAHDVHHFRIGRIYADLSEHQP